MARLSLARIGENASGEDYRVLVDRLWPRGVRKEQAPWDEWLRDVAPSTELRRWYRHDPTRHGAFRQRYLDELEANGDQMPLRHLLELVRTRPVVLLTATRNVEQSQVPILAAFLRGRGKQTAPSGECPPR